MASFWENFAEAMGWGKANHTKHFSDISEEKKQEYRDRYVDSAKKHYDEHNPDLRIADVNSEKDNKEYASFDDDSVYDTRVYEFTYSQPTKSELDSGEGRYSETVDRKGRVLVRTPKAKDGNILMTNWFDDARGTGHPSGRMGVYEAVLDDGTILDAKNFEALMKADPYGTPGFSTLKEVDHSDLGNNFAEQKVKWKEYTNKREEAWEDWSRNHSNSYFNNNSRWSNNWHRWVASKKPKKEAYYDGPDEEIVLYFRPGPNGE